ncbi:MAG: HypC/HybG/HupF family hydrogenase formation chaperone [Candidatus Heritagella sp.]
MCVALPGKVLRVDEKTAELDFSGNRLTARIGLVPVREGDWALVHAGCVIQVMQQTEAEELIALLQEAKE